MIGQLGKGKGAPPAPTGKGPPRKASDAPRHSAITNGPTKSIEELLAEKRNSLKKIGIASELTDEERKARYLASKEEDDKKLRNAASYLASAADQWLFLPGMENWTFATEFMEIGDTAAQKIASIPRWDELAVSDSARLGKLVELTNTTEVNELKRSIDEKLKELKWQRAFVKLTTFSAKDSPLILQEAERSLTQVEKAAMFCSRSREDQIRMLSEAMTEALCVSVDRQPGERVVHMLGTSPRVKEDLDDATSMVWTASGENKYAEKFEVTCGSLAGELLTEVQLEKLVKSIGRSRSEILEELFKQMHIKKKRPNLCLRRWDTTFPIWTEFRGFVYSGNLNVIGQYVHNMCFPELQDKRIRDQIEKDVQEAWSSGLSAVFKGGSDPNQFASCIVDFAWSEDGFSWAAGRKVIMIEVNPWNPDDGLCMSRNTTGLFDLEGNADHMNLVKNGPFQLVWVTEAPKIEAKKEHELLLARIKNAASK